MSITVSANGTCCFQEDSKDAVKPWDRPWTTNEMRQQSSNWNLAGDAGLLKHLQQFSQVWHLVKETDVSPFTCHLKNGGW